MTSGGFEVSKWPHGSDAPNAIAFQPRAAPDEQPTKEESQFARDVEGVLRRINQLMGAESSEIRESEAYREYYDRILMAARSGVEHQIGNLIQGAVALDSAKDYFVGREGPELRRKFLQKLNRAAAAYIIAALAGLVALEFAGSISVVEIDWKPPLQALLIATTTLCFSAWLYRMLAHEALTWDNLRHYGSDSYPPATRFAVLIGIAVALMLLLSSGAVELTVANIALEEFQSDLKPAALIGLTCGLAEKRVTNLVTGAF